MIPGRSSVSVFGEIAPSISVRYVRSKRTRHRSPRRKTNRRRRKAPAQAFLNIDIKVPKSIEEQKKIAEALSSLSQEIDLLKDQIELLKKQKKGLMQQLLTGKVRVKDE